MKVYAITRAETMKRFHGSLGFTIHKTLEPLYLKEETAFIRMNEYIKNLSEEEKKQYYVHEYEVFEE